MDGTDIFKLLSRGAKFDFKRFRSDANKLQLTSRKPDESVPGDIARTDGSCKTLQKTDRDLVQNDESDDNDTDDRPAPSDSDSVSQSSESEQEELTLLGHVKSRGEDAPNKRDRKRKRKRRATAAEIHQESVNRTRNVNSIHVVGTDVPEPFTDFSQLAERGFSPILLENIKKSGYDKPTPVQMQAIPIMSERREILASAPTGSGKTAAFLIPVIHHLKEPRNEGIRAMILAPSRELALQIHRECCRLTEGMGFRVHYIDKTSGAGKRAFSKKLDILVTTPNRLIYLMDAEEVKLNSVEWLIVDESDKLFEDGTRGFRDQLGRIYRACENNRIRRGLFSATYAFDVEEWCRLNLDNLVSMYIGQRNSATNSIHQQLIFVGSESGKLIAMRDLIKTGFQPPVLVFVQSKERAKELFHELIYDGMNVDVIHADRTQTERDNVVKCFRSGKIWILICTELMGRGIDFKGVNLVVNYDFPTSAISYIHRIGRTGRAGRTGKAITYFTQDDTIRLRSIANVMKQAGYPVPEYMMSLKSSSRKTKRKLSKSVPEREPISTIPLQDKKKHRKMREKLSKKQKTLGKKASKKKRKVNVGEQIQNE